MKSIQLGGNRFINHPIRGFALVDDEDFEKLSALPWSLTKNGYARTKNKWMHREVIKCFDKKLFVDHIDGNKLNNQKYNLRLATKSQNAANSKVPNHNQSGYKGVHFDRHTNKWRAMIWVNGIKKGLGRFSDISEAVKAYDEATVLYFGEFARPNLVDNLPNA